MNAEINVAQVKQKLDNKEDFVFIDVREPDEYKDYNIGAKNVPLAGILSILDELEDKKDKEIILHCRSGMRSKAAQQALQQVGFTNVHNLTGGVLAWQEKFG